MEILVSGSVRTRPKYITLLGLALLTPLFLMITQARATSNNCKDIRIVFLRGSGQNQQSLYLDKPDEKDFRDAEKQSYKYFSDLKNSINDNYPHVTLDRTSIHNFSNMYNINGYRAVPIGLDNYKTLVNTINADFSLFPGNYRQSVDDGVDELVGYLADQMSNCPDQSYFIGGYSQGAQVLGDSLFKLTEEQRSKILGVSMFGDPKYIGDYKDEASGKRVSYQWRRGSAKAKESGVLDARIPYVPADMASKTLSFCKGGDPICAGLKHLLSKGAHSQYNNEISYVVNELVQKGSSKLMFYERQRVGEPAESNTEPRELSQKEREKPRDILFMWDDNSNNDILSTFRYFAERGNVFYDVASKYPGVWFGARSYSEYDYGDFNTPVDTNIYNVGPYTGYDPSDPVFTSSPLRQAINDTYYGRYLYSLGSGDLADPIQISLQRAIVSPTWRDGETDKNIIILVNRPIKESYSINICNGAIRGNLKYPDRDGYKNCFTDPTDESWLKTAFPESCPELSQVIYNDFCERKNQGPTITHTTTRTMDDIVKLAQTFGVKINVVIPSKISSDWNKLYDKTNRDRLANIAYSTGGEFIYYDKATQFDTALLRDSIERAINKEPHSLIPMVNNNKKQVVEIHKDQGTILDVSGSGVDGSSYRWDIDDDGAWDEFSLGPVIEVAFDRLGTGEFRVQALGQDETVLAEARQAYKAEVSSEDDSPNVITSPSSVTAERQADNSVVVKWGDSAGQTLIISQTTESMPLVAVPTESKQAVINTSDDEISVMSIGEDTYSEPVKLPVVEYVQLEKEQEIATNTVNDIPVSNKPDATTPYDRQEAGPQTVNNRPVGGNTVQNGSIFGAEIVSDNSASNNSPITEENLDAEASQVVARGHQDGAVLGSSSGRAGSSGKKLLVIGVIILALLALLGTRYMYKLKRC